MPEMPEWVHVWFWLRFLRSPQILTPLWQQEWDPDAMGVDDYARFTAEWVRSGAPLTSAKQITMAMGADVELPF